jgi:hypothetical protein
VTFTSFTDLAYTYPSSVKFTVPGKNSLSVDYMAPAPTYNVTSVTNPNYQSGDVTVNFDSAGMPTSAKITQSGTGNSFVLDSGVLSANPAYSAWTSPNGSEKIVIDNQKYHNLNYTSYGTWATGINTGSGRAGAFAGGSPTIQSNIPMSGSATFTGNSMGFAVLTDGNLYTTVSNMSLSANFNSGGSVSVNSDHTIAQNINITNPPILIVPTLDFTGSLTPLVNTPGSFGGAITASGNIGAMSARFFGPSAQEIGGNFIIGQGNPSSYIGSFAAHR